MSRVKGFMAFPHGKDQVQQLAHTVSQSNVPARASGTQAVIQSSDRRVVDHGGLGGVPQEFARQVMALARHMPATAGLGASVFADTRTIFLRKDAEVAYNLARAGKACDGHHLGSEH